jgi:hypothetical protein
MQSQDKMYLGTQELTAAERLRSELSLRGVDLKLMHNAQTCNKGCSITVEVWAHPDDLPAINQVLAEQHQRLMAGLEYDAKLFEEVFDPSKAEATCPCCGTSFATSEQACPDCGLVFV